jgi:Flp pilus assembly protein TadD
LKAKDYSRSGEHDKAIGELRLALQDPSAAPYAHSILGAEYLKTGRIAEAVTELEVAVQLLPHNAPSLSNFGFALYLAGERERGEQEVRKALVLDSSNSKTRRVLDVIERGRGQ